LSTCDIVNPRRRLALAGGLLLLGIGVLLQVLARVRVPEAVEEVTDRMRALESESGDTAARELVDIARKYPERTDEAALRLSRLDGRKAPAALLEILGDPGAAPPLRAAAARALGRARLLSAAGTLSTHAGSDNIEVRAASLEALGLLGDPAGAAIVAPAVEEADPTVRRAALKALGNLRSEAATKALERFLARTPPPDPGEAALARRSLAVLRGEEPSKRF
jgi:HEAT repeat protein